jgi:two-component system, cell cycle sensor histidine kinase DivJ
LSNAVKFSNDGGTITLSMKRQGKMLNISVSDTGIGMGAETVRRIGEPFFQAQGGLSRRYEGTGLGLSIVKGLVELHEGRLHVTSEAGSGTTVTVLLPLDGPAHAHRPTADIAVLHKDNTNRHESTWPERERKSAAL